MGHGHEPELFVRPRPGHLADLAKAADVVLVVEDVGLEWCPFLCPQYAGERAKGHCRSRREAQDLEVVLRVTDVELLDERRADRGRCLHIDSWLRAIESRLPRPF